MSRGKIIAAVAAALLCVALLIALIPGCAAYNRYQTRQDAANKVKVAHIEIEKAAEEAKVNLAQVKATEAEAKKKVAESVGLKKAQVEINKSLTPLYVQHEYVQALEDIAHSPSNTIEFIPVGPEGIPIVGQTNVTPGQ
jgi:uncharacterized protein HemX